MYESVLARVSCLKRMRRLCMVVARPVSSWVKAESSTRHVRRSTLAGRSTWWQCANRASQPRSSSTGSTVFRLPLIARVGWRGCRCRAGVPRIHGAGYGKGCDAHEAAPIRRRARAQSAGFPGPCRARSETPGSARHLRHPRFRAGAFRHALRITTRLGHGERDYCKGSSDSLPDSLLQS